MTTDTANPPPTISEKLAIAVIGFFAFLQVYSVQAILPVLMSDLSASEVQAGMAVGATVLAIAIISPFMGMISDAHGRKSLIVASLLALALPTALIGMADSINQLILWRFFQGISIPGITVVLIAYISEEYQDHLPAMMSLYVAATVLGGFAGRFFAGHFDNLIGWQSGYLLMATATVLGAIWVHKTLPASKKFVISENFQAAFATLFAHAKNPHVISSGLLGACVLFSLVGCFSFVNLYLADAPYYLGTSSLANIFAIYLIGMIITPLSARVVVYFGMITTICLAVVVSMIGLLLTLLESLYVIIIGLTLMSSGVFITQSATISYLTSHVSHGRSLASGLYYMSYYGGGFFGAWACAIAYAQGQWPAVVGLIITVQLVALAVVLGFMKAKRC